MNDTATLGKHIIIEGGGHVVCEAAMHFTDFGKAVNVVEMAPDSMNGVFIQCKDMIDDHITDGCRINIHTGKYKYYHCNPHYRMSA